MGVVITFLWLVAIGLLIGAIRLPTALDIYVKDWYFVISKRSLIALILVAFVLPLVTVTVGRFRSALP
jgi:uncharacterized membrane protein YhaH (DUF805 family)